MSINSKYYYQKVSIPPSSYSHYSYEVERKEFSNYEECVEYLNTHHDGHGSIISSFNNLTVSNHSQLHSDLVRVYCSDPRLIYDIYGLLNFQTTLSEAISDLALE